VVFLIHLGSTVAENETSFATAENHLRNVFVFFLKLRNFEMKIDILTEVSVATSKLKWDRFGTKGTRLQ